MNNVNGDILKQLIFEAINLLTEKGAAVSAVIFDGVSKNSSTAEKLGCNSKNLEAFCPYAPKPYQTVYVSLDVCHVLKLARNASADSKIFCTPSGKKISWEYVLALHRTQQNDLLSLANKLSKACPVAKPQNEGQCCTPNSQPVFFIYNNIFSTLHLPEFKDSKATSDFIPLMNTLFYILNSKSKYGKYTKKPITLENVYEIEGYVMNGT